MIRMQIKPTQYINFLPLLEVGLIVYYRESEDAKQLSDILIAQTIKKIAEIVKRCRGKFCKTNPIAKMDEEAKKAAFFTIEFMDMQDIKEFYNCLSNISY